MKVIISFKHLEHTPALDEKIRHKTKKLEKYLGGNTEVHWTCYVKDGQHFADIRLHGPQFQYVASASSDSMYKTLDQALHKIEKQLQKQKEKWKGKLHRKGQENLPDEQISTEIEGEDEYYDKVGT